MTIRAGTIMPTVVKDLLMMFYTISESSGICDFGKEDLLKLHI